MKRLYELHDRRNTDTRNKVILKRERRKTRGRRDIFDKNQLKTMPDLTKFTVPQQLNKLNHTPISTTIPVFIGERCLLLVGLCDTVRKTSFLIHGFSDGNEDLFPVVKVCADFIAKFTFGDFNIIFSGPFIGHQTEETFVNIDLPSQP